MGGPHWVQVPGVGCLNGEGGDLKKPEEKELPTRTWDSLELGPCWGFLRELPLRTGKSFADLGSERILVPSGVGPGFVGLRLIQFGRSHFK